MHETNTDNRVDFPAIVKIVIGKYVIACVGGGEVWIGIEGKHGGEGGIFSELEVEKILDEFYSKNL